jgi:hypothetical protein
VVSVSSVYADEKLYYPLEVEPYTPEHHFEGGKKDPEFRTKLQIAFELVEQALEMEIPFRAVVADSLALARRRRSRGVGCSRTLFSRRTHRRVVGLRSRGWPLRDTRTGEAGSGEHRSRESAGAQHFLSAEEPADPELRASRKQPASRSQPRPVLRLYTLRLWIEQSYKQLKSSLGWAHYQVRKDLSIRRHWHLWCAAPSASAGGLLRSARTLAPHR